MGNKSSNRSSGTSQKSNPRNENKQTVEQRLKQTLCKQSKKRRKGRDVLSCIVSFVPQLYISVNAQALFFTSIFVHAENLTIFAIIICLLFLNNFAIVVTIRGTSMI